MYQIGLLIPCTSNGRPQWKTMKDTYLWNLTVKHFLLTMDKGYKYTFYIGYDDGDRIFADETQHEELQRFSLVFPNVSFQFICFRNIAKGHVTKMWNVLFARAYDDGCDYFYQCGDDIVFHTSGWVGDCIRTLAKTNGVGLVGPINNNNAILTQAFVSREHMRIFGWFFPEEIVNWCCDDWYNHVYKPNHFFPLTHHYCANEGGVPRYTIANDAGFVRNLSANTQKLRRDTEILAMKHKEILENYGKVVKAYNVYHFIN